jgi:16S rRNA (adenine1518-N6/adenine1519-N6)-dimethyltransferase
MQGHQARKRFSQNFLHDAHYVERIVAAVQPQVGDRIVEIGPGLGALTASLIAGARRIGAVEIDRDLAARLRARYAPEQLQLIEADALALDWRALAAQDARPLKIVGNLPYHIGTPLLFALLPIAPHVASQHFMLQREVVERMIAAPGSTEYGRLSAMLQYRYALTRLFVVPAGAFSPVPKEVYARVVTAAFGQRRKTLRNALAPLLTEAQIAAAGVDPAARAETLGVAQFVALAQRAAAQGAG